jgi:hypothetical protein
MRQWRIGGGRRGVEENNIILTVMTSVEGFPV